jgi:hypothetical protein
MSMLIVNTTRKQYVNYNGKEYIRKRIMHELLYKIGSSWLNSDMIIYSCPKELHQYIRKTYNEVFVILVALPVPVPVTVPKTKTNTNFSGHYNIIEEEKEDGEEEEKGEEGQEGQEERVKHGIQMQIILKKELTPKIFNKERQKKYIAKYGYLLMSDEYIPTECNYE